MWMSFALSFKHRGICRNDALHKFAGRFGRNRFRDRLCLAMIVTAASSNILIAFRYFLDDPAHGVFPALVVRRIRDLFARTFSAELAQHRHEFLLQRWAVYRGGGTLCARADDLCFLGRRDERCRAPRRVPQRMRLDEFDFFAGLVALPFARDKGPATRKTRQ